MSHPPELEALPTAGSLVGRHLIVREIAKGTVGPLYLARTQNNIQGNVTAVDTLARVIPLPADLPAKDDQYIAEAIWDSANVGHDMVLRVADVIAGKGWVTLVHDHYVGSLVASMHRRARELGSAFPSEVAARIALDVLDGLEQSRTLCETNRIPWRAGSVALGSLYLCGDGRTRALDGQVVAAVMRSAHMRMLCGTSASVAPELQYDAYEPDERTDVFSVGTVLWELLTGREILVDPTVPVANVILSVPKGTQVPQGLVYALHRALEIDATRRQSTLRELAVELVMGAEKVATYEQVIEFASTLLPFETAFQPEPSLASSAGEQPAAQQATTEQATAEQPAAQQSAATWEQQPQNLAVAAATEPVATPASSSATEPPAHRFASPFDPSPSSPVSKSASRVADDVPTVAAPAVAPVADELAAAAAATPEAQQVPNSAAAGGADTADTTIEAPVKPAGARLEQVSWTDDDVAHVAAAAKPAPTAAEPVKKSNGAKSAAAVTEDHPESIPVTGSGSQAAASKVPAQKIPEVGGKAIRRDSTRPGGAKSRSASSRPVDPNMPSGADLVAEVLRKAGKLPDPEAGKKKGGLQISMTTLILGFSTTVLAVVLIMILVQHKSSTNAPPAPIVVSPVAQPGVAKATPEPFAAQPAPLDPSAAQRASTVISTKSPDVAAAPADAKVEQRSKRPTKVGAAKSASGDEAAGDEKGQKKPKTYVPNDL